MTTHHSSQGIVGRIPSHDDQHTTYEMQQIKNPPRPCPDIAKRTPDQQAELMAMWTAIRTMLKHIIQDSDPKTKMRLGKLVGQVGVEIQLVECEAGSALADDLAEEA